MLGDGFVASVRKVGSAQFFERRSAGVTFPFERPTENACAAASFG